MRMAARGAFALAARCLSPFQPDPARVVARAALHHPTTGEPIDEVLAACSPAPHSYTGDDLVEISTHGGLLVPADVLAALVVAGARPPGPGGGTPPPGAPRQKDPPPAGGAPPPVPPGAPPPRARARPPAPPPPPPPP